MKNLLSTLVFVLGISLIAHSQHAKPGILLEPATWEFERFELPPSFAPEITYKGAEEIRFAPGMFNKDSANYFSYVFVAQIDQITPITQKDIQNYLVWYYKGLCSVTAKDRKLTIDSTKITAEVKRKVTEVSKESGYEATVNVFGVFADGAPVKLNMEILVKDNLATKKTFLVFLASPRDKKDPIWKDLHDAAIKGIRMALGKTLQAAGK
jgi:hypothetical protein